LLIRLSTIPAKDFDFSEMNKAEENKSSPQSVKKMLSEAGIKQQVSN